MLLFIILLLACEREQPPREVSSRPVAVSSLPGKMAAQSPYPCKYLENVEANLDRIVSDANLLQGNDTCVLRILDSLSGRFRTDGSAKFGRCFLTLAGRSDGYVADYCSTELASQFVAIPDSLLVAICSLPPSEARVVKKLLLSGIRGEVDYPDGIFNRQTVDSIAWIVKRNPRRSKCVRQIAGLIIFGK